MISRIKNYLIKNYLIIWLYWKKNYLIIWSFFMPRVKNYLIEIIRSVVRVVLSFYLRVSPSEWVGLHFVYVTIQGVHKNHNKYFRSMTTLVKDSKSGRPLEKSWSVPVRWSLFRSSKVPFHSNVPIDVINSRERLGVSKNRARHRNQ